MEIKNYEDLILINKRINSIEKKLTAKNKDLNSLDKKILKLNEEIDVLKNELESLFINSNFNSNDNNN